MVKLVIFFFLFVAFAPNAFSSGRVEGINSQPSTVENFSAEEPESFGTGSMLKFRGRVQIYGNEPHTFAGLAAEDGAEYAIFPQSEESKLRSLQGHLIDFTAILLDEPKGYGSLFLKSGTVTPVSWEIIQ
jgi:hypothetical protein